MCIDRWKQTVLFKESNSRHIDMVHINDTPSIQKLCTPKGKGFPIVTSIFIKKNIFYFFVISMH